jgi:membrane-associated phospholipid phosphatase
MYLPMVQLNIPQFKNGVALCASLALLLFTCSFVLGKNEFFLQLNADLGLVADYFFAAWTNGGNGIAWVLALVAGLFILKKPKAWPLLISGFVVSTIVTQVPKNFIFTNQLRPWYAITNHALVHHVSFVEPLHSSSFPSGHTMTAFTIYLIICLLANNKWWLYVGFAYAVLVGYSRIYLAQHFPLDVAGGITGAVISAWISLIIQKAVDKKKQ